LEVLTEFRMDGNYEEGKKEGEGKKKRRRRKIEGTGVSPLQAVQWFRVVLDEAQCVYFVPFPPFPPFLRFLRFHRFFPY
jgi:hypothetical protein